MSADNPKKTERFRTRVAKYLKLYFCFAQFFAQQRAFSVWFAINNRSLRMQRSNEAAIQSDYRLQSVIDPTLGKPLFHLQAAIDVGSFWKGVQDVIEGELSNWF